MWTVSYDKLTEKWLVSEFSKSCLVDPESSYYFRSEAELKCARKNAPSSNGWFWSEGEEDEYL